MNPKKVMSIDECVTKAESIISKQGTCLLLFDVVDSKEYSDRNILQKELINFTEELNKKFGEYFPINSLATPLRKEKGFQFFLGDGSWAGINSTEVIPKIINYQKKYFPAFSLYWGIAKNGYDERGISLVK